MALERVRTALAGRWRRLAVHGLFLLLSGGVLAALVVSSWPQLSTYDWRVRWWPLAAAVPAYLVALGLAIYAWSRLLQHLGGRLSYREHLRIYALTLVAARLPGAPWHIAGRAVLYKERGLSRRVTALAAGMEILMIASAGAVTGLLILPQTMSAYPWLWLSVLALAVAGLVLIHPRFTPWALRLLKQTEMPPQLSYRQLLLVMGVYVADWAAGGVVLFALASMVYAVPLSDLPLVIGAWSLSGTLATLVVVVPSGLGLREVTLSLLLGLIMPAGVAVMVAVIVRIFFTLIELIVALAASRL